MKYKAGDVVRVRKDILVNKRYGAWTFVEGMRRFIGNCVTINEALDGYYQIREDSCYITDEMLEDVEEEFKLPEKWCVRIKSRKEGLILAEWAGLDWYDESPSDVNYIIYDKCWSQKLRYGYTEITFDQFEKYVLKSESTPMKEEVKFEAGKWYKNPESWSSSEDFCKFSGEMKGKLIGYTDKIIKGIPYLGVTGYWCAGDLCREASISEIQQYLPEGHPDKVSSEKQSRESLLEEAKRRYPVGTRFISVNDKRQYTVKTNSHKWCNDGIDVEGGPWVYLKGKWAEIVESPTVQQKITPNDLVIIGCWSPMDTYDRIYTTGLDPINDESSKNKGESNSSTNESDFPIISTKRIINFSQLT